MIDKGNTPTATTTLELPPTFRFSASTGLQRLMTERVRNALTEARVQQLAALGFEVDAEPEVNTPFSIVTYFAPTGPGAAENAQVPLQRTWELAGQMIEQDLWQHPLMALETAKFQALGEDGVELLRRVRTTVDQYTQGATSIASVMLSVSPNVTDDGATEPLNASQVAGFLLSINNVFGIQLNLTTWTSFINSRLAGVEARQTPTVSLVKRETWAPTAAVGAIAFFGVGSVYTTQGLINAEGVPGNLIFGIPSGFWLKQAPNVVQQDDGRYIATTEWYWAERYDPFLYGAPIA